ncbi:PDZ domain-containing protein [Pedobacter sp. NJ-S-72]
MKDVNQKEAYLGIATKVIEGHVVISAVSRNSAAWVDGLNVNDELIGIDGTYAEPTIEKMSVMKQKKVGDVVRFQLRRDGLDKEIRVTLKASPNVQLVSSINPDGTEVEKVVFKAWTGI